MSVQMHSVYLLYGAGDRLLYVGLTSRGWARQEEHARKKAWWPEVLRVELEHFPSRLLAERREEELIRTRYPEHNVVYRDGATVEELRQVLTDHAPLQERVDEIDRVYKNQRFPDQVKQERKLLKAILEGSPLTEQLERERDAAILARCVAGESRKVIARQYGVSTKTVRRILERSWR